MAARESKVRQIGDGFPLWRLCVNWVALLFTTTSIIADERPSVLFISLDDLNDWIEPMGGRPQAKTPNLDRLAASGVFFDNAHCPAPSCNPSRTAIFTGLSPNRSGLYTNGQKMREVLPDAVLIPKYFSNNGYWAGGSGKMLHYFIDARSWEEYYPKKETENPFPPHIPWGDRPKSIPRGGPWQYVETDWHAFDVSDDAFGGDSKVADWVGEKLMNPVEGQPFFLACGIYRPHEPWFVPKKYFDMFPIEEVQLPPGYKEDDLDDLPPSGKRAGPNRYFAHIRAHGQWKAAVQAYLASIAYADAMLGRVLDALDASPRRDNTIVVLWSDHGWHLGEKQHWQKFTLWRASTRVPLIIRVPKGIPGLPEGTVVGGRSARPVNLVSLYPTLLELCGLPAKGDNSGPSLVPLLRDPQVEWNHVSVTYGGRVGSFGLSSDDWRYIRYENGDEELYHTSKDPYEWDNLAADPEYASRLSELRSKAPTEFATSIPPRERSLPELPWNPVDGGDAPASKPDGGTFDVVFFNENQETVRLYWVDEGGASVGYGQIESGKRKRQKTRPGSVWMIANQIDQALGYFVVDDRSARAMIPSK